MGRGAESYIFGTDGSEQRRLISQAKEFEQPARWLLDHIGLQPGWRVIDLGCGPIGILKLLSERVGPQGTVFGLENVPRFAAMAKEEIARCRLTNVQLLETDALASPLPPDSFDFVHERLVMINVPAPETVLREMKALARPGGIVAAEEVDDASWLCHPAHPSWDILVAAYHSAFRASGGNLFFGRQLPELMRAVGLEDIQCKIHVDAVGTGNYRRHHLFALLESLRDTIVSLGLLTDMEFSAHRKKLALHLDDPRTMLVDKLLVQAWGRKPRAE